jgi:hypothetical protein
MMGPRGAGAGYRASDSADGSQGCGYNNHDGFHSCLNKHRAHQSCQTDNMVLWALPMPSFQHPPAGAILINPEVRIRKHTKIMTYELQVLYEEENVRHNKCNKSLVFKNTFNSVITQQFKNLQVFNKNHMMLRTAYL